MQKHAFSVATWFYGTLVRPWTPRGMRLDHTYAGFNPFTIIVGSKNSIIKRSILFRIRAPYLSSDFALRLHALPTHTPALASASHTKLAQFGMCVHWKQRRRGVVGVRRVRVDGGLRRRGCLGAGASNHTVGILSWKQCIPHESHSRPHYQSQSNHREDAHTPQREDPLPKHSNHNARRTTTRPQMQRKRTWQCRLV
jgi:hypothetical protein